MSPLENPSKSFYSANDEPSAPDGIDPDESLFSPRNHKMEANPP